MFPCKNLLFLLLALGLALPARAAPPKVTSRIDRTRVPVGEIAVMTIHVAQAPKVPEVKPPQLANFTIIQVGKPQRPETGMPGDQLQEAIEGLARRIAESVPEGKKGAEQFKLPPPRQDYVILFRIQPEQAGDFTLPPFTVTVDGESSQTKPVDLVVSASAPVPSVMVEWSLSNPTPRANEDVLLYLDVLTERADINLQGREYTHLPVRNILFLLPKPADMAGVKFVKTLDQLAKDHAVPSGKVGFYIKGVLEPLLFKEAPRNQAEDAKYFRYRLAIPVRFTTKGQVQIPSADMLGEVYMPLPDRIEETKKRLSAPRGRWLPFATGSPALHVNVR